MSKKKIRVVNVHADSPEEALAKVKKFVVKEGVKVPDGVLAAMSRKLGVKSVCPCGKDHGPKGKVLKAVPATPEEAKAHEEILKRTEQIRKDMEKLRSDSDRWWAQVKLRLPDGFTHPDFHYNVETKNIEFIEKGEDDDFEITSSINL